MENGYNTLIRLRREQELNRKGQYKVESKKRLRTIAEKKIRTTMIGALSTIEQHLGFLWDNDSEQAEQLRQIYSVVRQEILDRGNNQIRNLVTELDQYDIEWLRYNLILPIKKEKKDE